jgi:hypothetical protein
MAHEHDQLLARAEAVLAAALPAEVRRARRRRVGAELARAGLGVATLLVLAALVRVVAGQRIPLPVLGLLAAALAAPPLVRAARAGAGEGPGAA